MFLFDFGPGSPGLITTKQGSVLVPETGKLIVGDFWAELLIKEGYTPTDDNYASEIPRFGPGFVRRILPSDSQVAETQAQQAEAETPIVVVNTPKPETTADTRGLSKQAKTAD